MRVIFGDQFACPSEPIELHCECALNSIVSSATIEFNSLPGAVRSEQDIIIFKKNIKIYFTELFNLTG